MNEVGSQTENLDFFNKLCLKNKKRKKEKGQKKKKRKLSSSVDYTLRLVIKNSTKVTIRS